MLRHHIKTAWLNTRKNKGYFLINVAGLALGICACLVIYLITSYEFSFDAFHPQGGTIYRIGGRVLENDGNAFTSEAWISAFVKLPRERIPPYC